MIHTRNVAKPCNFKWISACCPDNCFYSSKKSTCSHFNASASKFCHQRASHATEPLFLWRHRGLSAKIQRLIGFRGFATVSPPEDLKIKHHGSRNTAKAQSALFDYLHSTRGIYFTDAEQISKNCPIFVCSILEKVEDVEDTEKELVRFLRYHPINEFEPFFESIGLKPWEYKPLLPRELIYLSDVSGLLNNYHELRDYGIALDKMGKMYKEAKYMFMLGPELLKSKLMAIEQLGFSRSTVIKLVASTPALLLGDHVNEEFVLLLNSLKAIGISLDCFWGSLSEKNACYWGKMLVLLHFFKDMGFDEEKIATLISNHPGLLIHCSGKTVFSLISLLLKVGVTRKEIFIMFTEFPRIQIGSFTRNLWRAFRFLVEIEMDFEDIKRLIQHHRNILGLTFLKRSTSILTNLGTGKRRLCNVIIKYPCLLQTFVMGSKVLPLPTSGLPNSQLPTSGLDLQSVIIEKKKFLCRLGFVENSKEMNDAFRLFRGKGDELQDRFNFFVKCGLDSDVVTEMLKRAPHILNQKIEVLDEKLSFIVNSLGYPLSSVARLPQCMSYTVYRVKLRHLMYDWLKERGKAAPTLSLGSIIACSDKMFIKRYVSLHPEGPKTWENFKKAVYSFE